MFFLLFGSYILMTEEYTLLIILPCIVFIGGIWYTFRSFYNNIFLFCFLVCFFTFLLGGQVINKFMHVYGYNFSEKIEIHTDLLLLISLLGLLFGYILTGKTNNNKHLKPYSNYNDIFYRNVRKISKNYFFVTYLFWVLILLDNVRFVLQYDYVNYYLSYSSSIPAIIRQIGYMAPMALYIFLATMPTKKEAKITIIMYLVYLVLSLGTGRRIYFMTGLLFIFAYMMLRNVVHPEKKPWIDKKAIIKICIIVPMLLVMMYLFEYVRSESYVGTVSQYSPLIGFFIRQGTSINVIKYAEMFKIELNPEAFYSLYNTLKWLQNSIFNNFLQINLSFEFGRQTQGTALYGTYLADFVSYKANSYIYLSGMGYGSCYIAELYADFGYIGVFIGNIIYGFLLCKLLKNATQKGNIWLVAVGFFMVGTLFKAPRATFDAFWGQLLYFNSWGPLAIIYIIANIYDIKNKKLIQN